MAENLKYASEGSVCYENSDYYCAKYGRLYNLDDAMNACPAGWHLATDMEWETLMVNVGGPATAGTKLKAKSGWEKNGNGTDNYGFSALPGGNGNSDGNFDDAGFSGIWWSTTGGAVRALRRYMDSNSERVNWFHSSKTDLNSVRCVAD
jgi:uncharacterized protein (TIGR02145 family)